MIINIANLNNHDTAVSLLRSLLKFPRSGLGVARPLKTGYHLY